MERSEITPPAQADAVPAGSLPVFAHVSWWARTADIAAVVLVAAALGIAVFGGFSVRVPGTVISAHSVSRLLFIAAAVLVIRHYFLRAPSIAARLTRGAIRLWRAESFRDIAPPFAWSRAAVLVTAYLAVVTIGYPTKIPFHVSANEFANLPARYDAGWYLTIAQRGYAYDSRREGKQNVAFFPGFPMAMRTAGVFLGGSADDARVRRGNPMRILWSGVVVNLLAFAAALGYLYRMVRAFADREAAASAVQFALAYPMAFFFVVPYSEGLFLLAAIGAFYHFGRGQLGAAAGWGVLAGLTRPNGFLLVAPLLAIAVAHTGPLPRLGAMVDRWSWFPSERRAGAVRYAAVALAPLLGMLAFSAYLYASWGDPLLWTKLHAAWGRTYQGLDPALGTIEAVQASGLYAYTTTAGVEVLHVLFFLLAVGLSVPIAFRLGVAYTAFILLTVVPPLMAGGWMSMARMTVVLFPIYAYLGVAVRPAHRAGLLIAFGVLQGLATILFFTWRQFY